MRRVIKNWKPIEEVFNDRLIDESGWIQNRKSPGRRFQKLDTHPLWNEAFDAFGLRPECVEPLFKIFIGHNYEEGAFVHRHRDPNVGDLIHTRCNFMIRKPPVGGNPIIEDIEYEIENGDLWLCVAGIENHSSTPISGGDRLIISFGGLVHKRQFSY